METKTHARSRAYSHCRSLVIVDITCINATPTHHRPTETPITTYLCITRIASSCRNLLQFTTGLVARTIPRAMCMLMIERRGQHYLVHFVQADNHFSAFALPSQSFPDIQSLIGFLLHVLHAPQDWVAACLRSGSLAPSPEQMELWGA